MNALVAVVPVADVVLVSLVVIGVYLAITAYERRGRH